MANFHKIVNFVGKKFDRIKLEEKLEEKPRRWEQKKKTGDDGDRMDNLSWNNNWDICEKFCQI